MLGHEARIVALSLAVATGCATHLGVLEGGTGGGVRQDDFWPPPRATSVWTASSSAATVGEMSDRVAGVLYTAGYEDARWHPIGARCEHGFAVTTRLERIDDDATPKSVAERWTSLYPVASSLRWLEGARAPRLPAPGRYRVLLIAFTDLLMADASRATRWNEQTVMAGPNIPEMPPMQLARERRVTAEYRIGVYVYEYELDSSDAHGAFVPGDDEVPAAVHVRRSGLLPLGQ
jgi:hypothetical protein